MDIKEALTHAEGMTISEASSMTEMALQELAAEVRRLTVLRPMESAPRDGSQFVALIHRGDDWSGVDDPEGPKWHCCYYHQDRYGEALMMQQKPTNYRCLGWLPLPTPINEGD